MLDSTSDILTLTLSQDRDLELATNDDRRGGVANGTDDGCSMVSEGACDEVGGGWGGEVGGGWGEVGGAWGGEVGGNC